MKLKNYLIAVDLDGTLITGFDHYDRKSFRYLKKLAKHNYIIISTGRPFRSSKYYYDLLKLKTPIINYNGALLHNPNDVNFPKQTIHVKKEDIATFIKDNPLIENVFCEIEDNIYLQKETDYIKPYLHMEGGNLTIGHLEDILPADPNGAIIFSKLGSEDKLNEYVNTVFKDKYCLRFWSVKDVVVSEFYNPLTSKANALRKICEYYNLPQSQTIAIGDGHNDIEMIEFVKYGVAMKNGHPDLLKIAQYQTVEVKKSGVYKFLKNFNKNIMHSHQL